MQNDISSDHSKMVKRLNATLPPKLAQFVGEITGESGLYETPSEFVRDLIRRYMENTQTAERYEINHLLRQSIRENDYTPLAAQDAADIRSAITE
jgi:Arc/MetJ-type ribon-helix-helix transcriptional regulator